MASNLAKSSYGLITTWAKSQNWGKKILKIVFIRTWTFALNLCTSANPLDVQSIKVFVSKKMLILYKIHLEHAKVSKKMKPWQALSNKAPRKGGKEEQRERTQVWARSSKIQGGPQRVKGTNYVLKPPPLARSKLEEEREEKPKSSINLEEPSFAMIMCLKIKVACTFGKAIYIFNL